MTIKDENGTTLKPCPQCGCDDDFEIDSSSAAELSWVTCNDCDYQFQSKCREENIGRHWNKHIKEKAAAIREAK